MTSQISQSCVSAEPDYSDYAVRQDRLEKAFDILTGIPDWPIHETVGLGQYVRQPGQVYARGGVVCEAGEPPVCDGVCHGYMSSRYIGNQTGRPQVTFSKWNYRAEPEYQASQDAWFDWITGPTSPWKSVFPPPRIVKGVDISTKEFMWKHGFLFWHLDKLPSNAQQSFLIATRAPTQRTGLVHSWHRLVTEHGFDPAFAAQWLVLWMDERSGDMSYQGYQKNFLEKEQYVLSAHGISEYFLLSNFEKDYVENFVHGRMVQKKMNLPYAQVSVYTPVNEIWMSKWMTGRAVGDTYRNADRIDEPYTKYLDDLGYASVRYEGSFFANDQRSQLGMKIYTKEQMLKLADHEMKRMKIGPYKEGSLASAA